MLIMINDINNCIGVHRVIGTKHITKTGTKSQLSFSVIAFWLTTFFIVSMYGILKECLM